MVVCFLISCNSVNNKDTDICGKRKTIGKIGTLKVPLQTFESIQDAIQCSQKSNKPIIILFYSIRNISNRESIWRNFVDPNIMKIIDEKFLLVVLQLDNPNTVEIEKQGTLEATTIGKINTNLEIKLFNSNQQPLCAILNNKSQPIVKPIGFLSLHNKDSLLAFLEKGIKENERGN